MLESLEAHDRSTGVGHPVLIWEPALAAVSTFVLYSLTCARDVLWGDPAKLTLWVRHFKPSLDQDAHLTALAWAWPFSRLPIGPFAFRVTIASVAAAALAVGFFHALLLSRCDHKWAARAGTASLMVSHTFWFVSTMPESYPVAMLSMTAAAWLLFVRDKSFAAGAVLGIGATANVITLLAVPAVVWWEWRTAAGAKRLGAFLGGIVFGVLIPAVAVVPFQPATTLDTAAEWSRVWHSYIGWRLPIRNGPLLAVYLLFNFAGPALLLMHRGVRRLGGEARIALGLFAIAYYGFALFYLPQRAYLLALPVYLAAAAVIAEGAETAIDTAQPWRSWLLTTSLVVMPIAVYAFAPAVVRGHLPAVVRDAPYRDEARFYLQPWKNGDDSTRRYIDAVGERVPGASAVFGDFTLLMPLLYASNIDGWKPTCSFEMVDGLPATRVVGDIQAFLAHRHRVFLLDDQPYYFPDEIRRHWALVPTGVERLLEVRAREPAGAVGLQ